ncbi:hypothetical protein HK104_005455 [Borealophlyctis nickersoniae]|nr:hypothetical protein HK104_005455 [Borealophlyctis nickersoniae]
MGSAGVGAGMAGMGSVGGMGSMGGVGGGGQQHYQQQPTGGQAFFGQEFINDFQGSAATQLGVQLGTKAFAQVQENVNQNLNRWINLAQLKYFFNVSHSYVAHKLRVLVFPWGRLTWMRLVRRSEQNGQMEGFKPPREDLNAPDLYIPVMAFVTYILMIGIQLGLEATAGKTPDPTKKTLKTFTPDVLGLTGTTAFFMICTEVMFIKLGCYLLNISAEGVGLLDLVAYSGYKFIPIIITLLAKWFLPKWAMYVIFAYLMICLGFFTMRTLKYIVVPDAINPVVQTARKRRINFLFSVSALQIFFSWLLI